MYLICKEFTAKVCVLGDFCIQSSTVARRVMGRYQVIKGDSFSVVGISGGPGGT